jgi:tetratricopeptide (TPR) repeat protein
MNYLDLCDLARAAAGRGELETARARFEEAAALKSDSVDVLYGLATVCFVMGDNDAAKDHFTSIQGLDPTHAGAAINLGAIANTQGDYDEAIKQLRKGISLDPKRGEAYYNLGIAYRKMGRNELAIQAYREAHHHNPRMVEALFNLANIYFEMERFEQAALFYRKALDVNPGFRKAQEGLLRVERKMKPKPTLVGFEDTGNVIVDPYANDPRLDRTLDPDHDFDSLARAHSATAESKRATEAWLKSTEKLHETVRELAIAISTHGGGAEVADQMDGFRDSTRKFRALRQQVEDKRDEMIRMRDHLVERG